MARRNAEHITLMTDSVQQQLRNLLMEVSVKRGNFTLASGKTSNIYVDVRQTSLHAQGSAWIAQCILAQLDPLAQGIGGPTLGADPVVSSVVALSTHFGRPVHGFLIRKESKGHGTQRFLEGRGNLPDGSRVAIVEDTTTTGGSLLQAIERAENEGLTVIQCMTVVDRQQGAVERLAEHGFTLQPLFTLADLSV